MMIFGGVGWDRKKFPEFNLHVYGKDDTKIIVHNMEIRNKRKELERKTLEKQSTEYW